jgi:hypothetical protein
MSPHGAAPRQSQDTVAGDSAVAGNARLTAMTGLVLLVLLAVEVATVVLGVDSVLTAHVAIGLALTPFVALKLGSAGWRIVKYYRGDSAYARRGTPPTYLRVLGALFIVLTVALFGSGLLTYLGPGALHAAAVETHKVSFYPWAAVLVVHVVVHFAEAVRLAAADLLARSRVRLAGVRYRRAALLGSLAIAVVLAVTLTGNTGQYLRLHPKHPHGHTATWQARILHPDRLLGHWSG